MSVVMRSPCAGPRPHARAHGGAHSCAPHDGIEFADYRPYSPGDDLRRVDWNAYARLGTMHIRQAQAEHDTVLYLLVDASPSMQFGNPSKFDQARRLAAALGYVALAHLDSVVVASPGAHIGGSTQLAAADFSKRFRGRAELGNLFKHLQETGAGESSPFDPCSWAGPRADGRAWRRACRRGHIRYAGRGIRAGAEAA